MVFRNDRFARLYDGLLARRACELGVADGLKAHRTTCSDCASSARRGPILELCFEDLPRTKLPREDRRYARDLRLRTRSTRAAGRPLYTLPTVAIEVVQLLNEPHVDPREIKACIERDPALTAKVLKVVNSSLFGLSGEVANVTQAIALLGLNPLKLLVLGFSLPDELFASLAADQLQLYWSETLNRASPRGAGRTLLAALGG